VIEARAEKARRDEQLIVARNNLDFASAKLRLTINVNPDHNFLPRMDFRVGAGLTGIAGELKPGTMNPFPGGYGTSLERLGGNFYNYSVGVVLQVPLGNGQAHSKHSQARIELEQEKARQRELVNQVILEGEKSLGDVDSGYKRIQTSQQAKTLAEENLRMQEKRFQVGLITQKDVIDFEPTIIQSFQASV